MKPGLKLTDKQLASVDFTKTTPGIVKRMQLQHDSENKLKKMLDKWRQSGHSHKLGEEIILKIKGE